MPRLSGGQAIVAALERVGIDTVFGIPGVHTGGLYDALLDAPGVRHILSRHEQGAAHMADGYARASGRIACVSTITGPGVTNAVTALGEAYADSSPVLHIATTLESHLSRYERGELHELRDQSGVLRGVVGYHRVAQTVREIPSAIAEAVHHMRTARPGPASIEVPLDLLSATDEVDLLRTPADMPAQPAPDVVARAAEVLRAADAPYIFVGSGGMDAGAALVAVAERLQAPVLTAISGKGAFPESHPLSLGCQARLDESAYEFLSSRDAALIVGCRLGARVTDNGRLPLPGRLVQIDIDSAMLGRARSVTVGIHADAGDALGALSEELPEPPASVSPVLARALRSVREDRRAPAGNQAASDILAAVRTALPDDGVLVNDMTLVCYQAPRLFELDAPRSFMFPTYFGTLGFSLPAAIGAKIACPERAVVSLSGDGGFLFTGEELATAVREDLCVIALVLNDGMFGAIDSYLKTNFAGRALDLRLRNPDFVALARAYGAHGTLVRQPAELTRELRLAFERTGPTLVEYALG